MGMATTTTTTTTWTAELTHPEGCTDCVRLASHAQALARCTGSVEATERDGIHVATVRRAPVPPPQPQARQQVQLTITVDVAVPEGGMAHVLHQGSVSRDPEGEVDVLEPYTRLDYFTSAVVDQLRGILEGTSWDGYITQVDARTVASYVASPTDPF